MTGKPLLSVIMPVHDGADWMDAALKSLTGQEGAFEIIVIDSSPGDSTASIAEAYFDRLPIQLLRRPDLGPWQVKTNLGVELAGADHACILHQDDLWLPGRLDAIRTWIAATPEALLHLAPTLVIDRNGRSIGRWQCPLPADEPLGPQFMLRRLLVQNFVAVPATVFSRSAWITSGGMDEQLWYTPDWDMWSKLSSAGPSVYHDEVTTAFRVHSNSQTVTGSRDGSAFRQQMEIVLERYLDRIPLDDRTTIERAARASINVNVMLAAASGGSIGSVFGAAAEVLSLGPAGMRRYLRDSRLRERVMPRLIAKASGTF